MIRRILIAAMLASAIPLAQAQAPACFEPKQKFDARFVGNWEIAQWQVRYSIRQQGNQICLYARDASANEWFQISGLDWDGKTLAASFLLPSTKWRTESRLTLLDNNRVRDEYSHPEGRQTDVWTRRK
ncbi:MAG: hypothetical protein CGU28_08635 [Candidatus Dactylopiibacterium carminicum]|uniref:Lipocalin-like domain-containing protein n=1 Tax=Candidatus Dactylopiibacterium carminicum TaxID=857335 RepID=A0A272ET39_9RHOO|nr:hypothetical protein [Candidatus Dactylopiibacterium carminicum]KAF7598924.1 hypothetical protein BGI27_10660 [Candidatus Dactylopiibacterium carminicum]PAS92900.1 MAG: hypothetical protein CGU29_09745 [Candidatus Dactylopiibacterium carminicum]PAS96479.1 MAG: hypothetical protein CGU28_08635 [Candidatus Dactylopiibacterium carminicum]PAS98940.1 MAG: hypothetical protein BSR46_10680 [Candidatus Dactylopiibacterium carminicum]